MCNPVANDPTARGGGCADGAPLSVEERDFTLSAEIRPERHSAGPWAALQEGLSAAWGRREQEFTGR